MIIRLNKWCHLELNQGHTDFQSVALPTELWHQLFWRRKDIHFFYLANNSLKKYNFLLFLIGKCTFVSIFIFMQRLIIDIGNTSVKLAVYNDDTLTMHQQADNLTLEILQKIDKEFPMIKSSILSAVRDYPETIDTFLKKKFFHITVNSETALPFVNEYKTPATLGKDRIAAAAAAINIFPGENVLVIDAGTSITYDLITKKGTYLGGGISPGIMMRFKALNTFTGKLPLITEIDDAPLIGDDTRSSIKSGVLNGILAEVNGIVESYRNRFDTLKIIISGGDYKYFDKKLKNSIFATPNIVMQGLLEILKINEDQ